VQTRLIEVLSQKLQYWEKLGHFFWGQENHSIPLHIEDKLGAKELKLSIFCKYFS
jgi:hypothetical protein